jgi:hypothetical protein
MIRRERRKLRRLIEDAQNQEIYAPSPLPVFGPPVPPKPARLEIPAGMPSSPAPVDPVYPPELFMTPSPDSRKPQSARTTILAPFVPWSLKSRKSRSSMSRSVSVKTKSSAKGAHPPSLGDLDIAGLLEEASQQPAATEAPRGYPAASPHTITPIPTPTVPPSPSVSAYSADNSPPPIPRGRSNQEPDVPLSPLSKLSQDWTSSERQSVPEAVMAAVTSRDGLSPKRRPLPTPPRGPGSIRTLSKNPVRF